MKSRVRFIKHVCVVIIKIVSNVKYRLKIYKLFEATMDDTERRSTGKAYSDGCDTYMRHISFLGCFRIVPG